MRQLVMRGFIFRPLVFAFIVLSVTNLSAVGAQEEAIGAERYKKLMSILFPLRIDRELEEIDIKLEGQQFLAAVMLRDLRFRARDELFAMGNVISKTYFKSDRPCAAEFIVEYDRPIRFINSESQVEELATIRFFAVNWRSVIWSSLLNNCSEACYYEVSVAEGKTSDVEAFQGVTGQVESGICVGFEGAQDSEPCKLWPMKSSWLILRSEQDRLMTALKETARICTELTPE